MTPNPTPKDETMNTKFYKAVSSGLDKFGELKDAPIPMCRLHAKVEPSVYVSSDEDTASNEFNLGYDETGMDWSDEIKDLQERWDDGDHDCCVMVRHELRVVLTTGDGVPLCDRLVDFYSLHGITGYEWARDAVNVYLQEHASISADMVARATAELLAMLNIEVCTAQRLIAEATAGAIEVSERMQASPESVGFEWES